MHGLMVEGFANPRDVLRTQCRSDLAIQDEVAITAGERTVAGVERLRHFARPQDTDLLRQAGVRSQHPAAFAANRISVEMCDLDCRMDASVGASRSYDFDGVIGDVRDGGLDFRLNAVRVRLCLPAGKRTTVVFDAEGDARHGEERSGRRLAVSG